MKEKALKYVESEKSKTQIEKTGAVKPAKRKLKSLRLKSYVPFKIHATKLIP
jgi:hypothetical protein